MHYGGENRSIYNVYSFTRLYKLMYNLYSIGSALATISLNRQHLTFSLMHAGGESAMPLDFDFNAADSGSDISSDSISDDEDGMDSGSNSDSSGSH
jgi:hypothetical protein